MAKTAQYKAFISYSHSDARWGYWIHRALETNHVPKNLVGKTTAAEPVPPRITPIFRDHDDLAAASYFRLFSSRHFSIA